jgi:type VI secretion system protein ImpL
MFGGPPSTPSAAIAPSTLERSGAWSLFRLIDGSGARRQGDWIVASFIVGGIDLQYRFGGGGVSPLTLPALREFRCPSGI